MEPNPYCETPKPAQFNFAVWKDEYSGLIVACNSLPKKKDFF